MDQKKVEVKRPANTKRFLFPGKDDIT